MHAVMDKSESTQSRTTMSPHGRPRHESGGDGEQDVRFVKHMVEAMLLELLVQFAAVADKRLETSGQVEALEGCQHFAFKEYKNIKGL
jgi:hypothetical protein